LDLRELTKRGSAFSFQLGRIGESYGSFFPRVAKGKSVVLRLSQIDQALFDALEEGQWVRPLDIIKKSENVIHLILPYGDYFMFHRLQGWVAHNKRFPAILVTDQRKAANRYSATAYRLTPHGKKLREDGLACPGEAPPMFVGGCRIYAGDDHVWVRRSSGRAWRIEQLHR
jgi:hypothetical protein